MSMLLFDIGGTSMRMATGDDHVENVRKVPTPEHPLDAIALLVGYAREMPECRAAFGGIAGVIEDGTVISSPHLPGWNDSPFAEMLSNALNIPVQIRNDAELAGLGEAVYGAGKGYGIVAYLGIGTGIGGSYVAEQDIVPHAHGFEPGHQILDIDTGETFEGLVSGHALEERFSMKAKDLPRTVYEELTPTLATGIYNLILAWSPDVLVLGGSLMNEKNGYRVSEVQDALQAIPTLLPSLPPIVASALKDENGLHGALAMAVRG
jgi:mannose-6-phosphate isomerase